MELETDPREDSIRLTNAFHNQLRSSRDDFLLNGEELTLDHVNRLSSMFSTSSSVGHAAIQNTVLKLSIVCIVPFVHLEHLPVVPLRYRC